MSLQPWDNLQTPQCLPEQFADVGVSAGTPSSMYYDCMTMVPIHGPMSTLCTPERLMHHYLLYAA